MNKDIRTMIDKNLHPINNKGKAHGYWESYYNDGDISLKCTYDNGFPVGYEIWDFTNNSGGVSKKYHIR